MDTNVCISSAEGEVYGAKQRVTGGEALRAWTLGGAYAAFAEKHQGSIEPGKLADFVVLSADPASEKPEHIKDIRVEKTFVGGRLVFGALPQAAEKNSELLGRWIPTPYDWSAIGFKNQEEPLITAFFKELRAEAAAGWTKFHPPRFDAELI